jgi:uncharacterized protein
MKWTLIGVIHLYRRLPPSFKRKCLFKETCSSHVLRMTRASGFCVGLRSLRLRILQCRPGYVVFFDNDENHWAVRFADGSTANRDQLADFVLALTLDLKPATIRVTV